MQRDRKEPLYRKVNTKARGNHHWKGRGYKRVSLESQKMKRKICRGLDYTPLFKYLLSKVGQDWDKVYSDIKPRVKSIEPIFWMVKLYEHKTPYEQEAYFTVENGSFSKLYVDENNKLQIIDPNIDHTTLEPFCFCCTHTFNGKLFTKKWNYKRMSYKE
jgi:hypothetical protein